jgi:hypothetical protein
MSKYGYMYREMAARYLKNKSYSRKSFKSFFRDINVLISEASYLDENLIDKSSRYQEASTDCLVMAISMHLESMVEYLIKGFGLELYYPAELPEFFY